MATPICFAIRGFLLPTDLVRSLLSGLARRSPILSRPNKLLGPHWKLEFDISIVRDATAMKKRLAMSSEMAQSGHANRRV